MRAQQYCLHVIHWHSVLQVIPVMQVDPPRAGLDPATEALLPEFANVVYISCNPVTLEANLRPLLATHSLHRFAVFDQARPSAQ